MRLLTASALGLGALGIGTIVWAGLQLAQLRREVGELRAAADRSGRQLEIVAGEVTRFRLEQRAEGQGPQALLEKLRAYAPALVSARTTSPDFAFAQREMDAVLRAFGALGEDGWQPVMARFEQLDPQKSFDELRWLLEAAVRCNPERGNHLVGEVLAGRIKPNPRLRWVAADLLLRTDPERARRGLRQILLTETKSGLDPDRAAAQGLATLDPAATAVAGFHNFVLHYLRSDDPETEDTLLQVLMRTGQDVATLQEAIEELGRRKAVRAVRRIEDLYLSPPGAQQNPLFLNKCLDALASIRGQDARQFLEEQLPRAQHELVVAHIDDLLKRLGAHTTAAAGGDAPGTEHK